MVRVGLKVEYLDISRANFLNDCVDDLAPSAFTEVGNALDKLQDSSGQLGLPTEPNSVSVMLTGASVSG